MFLGQAACNIQHNLLEIRVHARDQLLNSSDLPTMQSWRALLQSQASPQFTPLLEHRLPIASLQAGFMQVWVAEQT